jgi:hypothetical protein
MTPSTDTAPEVAPEAAPISATETPPDIQEASAPSEAMLAITLRTAMLSYNHLSYAVKAGCFNSLTIEELKSVVDNVAALKSFIPEALRKKVE